MLDYKLGVLFGCGELGQKDEMGHFTEPVDYCKDDSVAETGSSVTKSSEM